MRSESLALACSLAKEFEGLRLDAYYDPVGFPTQGYGRLLSRIKGEDLGHYPRISPTKAVQWLEEDMARAARGVGVLCPVVLTVGQKAALSDFVYNLGGGYLEISTLRRMVNRGEMEEAADQFKRWVYAGGKRLAGLVRRRNAEREVFLS